MKIADFNFQIEKLITIITLAGVISLSACSDSSDSQSNKNFDAYIQQGKTYLDMHQFKAAFSSTREAIKADPSNIEGYLVLAEIHKKSGHPQSSVKTLEIFTGSKDPEYYFSLIDAYQQSGKLISSQKMIEQQEKSLSTQAQRLKFVVAQQLLYSNQLTQAKTAFSELLKDPKFKMESMLALAKIEAASGNTINAINIIDDIIELDATNTEGLFLKSQIYIRMGELNNAENSLSLALTTLPSADIYTTQRVQIIQNLIQVLTKQGRSAEAMIYSRILAEEFPEAETLSLRYNNALELFKKQQFLAAKEILIDIQNNNPGHKKSATLLGLILFNEGDPESAGKYLAGVIDPEISPVKLTELYMATQLQQNKSEEVLNLLEHIPEKSRNVETWVLYLNAAIQQKEFTKAKMALDKAKLLTPQSISVALAESFYYNSLPEPQAEKALASISVILSSNPENKKLQMLYIRQLLTLKKFTEADKYVANLKIIYSENTDTLLNVANYYIYQQNLDDARQIIENILALKNDHLQALYLLATINQIERNWQATLANYEQIINYYPDEIAAYQGVVISLIKQKKDPLKAADYLPKNYETSILALTLANFTLQQSKLDLATRYAKEAENELPQKYLTSLKKLTLQLNLTKATVAFTEKDYLKAQTIVLAALKQDPEDIRLLSLLTRTEIRLSQYIEAEKTIEKIAKLLPNNSLATRFNAIIFMEQGEQQQAISLLTSYWQKTKDEAVAEQMYIFWKNDSSEKASKFLSEWQEASPQSLTAMRYKAINLQNTGKQNEALLVYDALLEQDPNNIVSLNNAAWLHFEKGNPIAVNLAQRAYKLMPENAAILDTYGWILYKNGELQQGKILIEKASLLSPDEPDIKAHLLEINSQ